VILLNTSDDDFIIDNSSEISSKNGKQRDLVVSSSAYGIPAIVSASTIKVPNGSDEFFVLTGTNSVTSITALRPKRRITLILTDTASTAVLVDGSNLKLAGDFGGVGWAYSTITLVCDGVTWIELCRSKNS
jgi:hypothetical protein